MNGRADAAEIGTTIIIYSLCVDQSALAAAATGEARKPLVLYAPFSFIPPAKVKPRNSRSHFNVYL